MKNNIFKKLSLLFTLFISFQTLVSFALPIDNTELLEHDNRRPRPRRYFCYDQRVDLLCKVDGRLRHLAAYTDCGRTRFGSYCNYVQTPGYYQIKMNLEFRCERDGMIWSLGEHGWCEVRSWR